MASFVSIILIAIVIGIILAYIQLKITKPINELTDKIRNPERHKKNDNGQYNPNKNGKKPKNEV